MTGLTGGIGSGKSTIAHELERRGYKVYDTDSEAKRLIVTSPEVKRAIIALFGEEAYAGDNYNRTFVAQQVFADPDKLQRLNRIVHPAVEADLKQSGADIVESAILYESGLNRLCDKVVAVVAPETIRLQRAMQRDHADETAIRARMASQPTDEALRMRADVVLQNDGTQSISDIVDSLLKQIEI